MADLKISQLTSATLPLAGTEVLPIVQSSTTKKVATNDLTVKNVRSNATTGILQVTGPSAASTRTMTVPDANFTAARIDAAQSFTGDQTLSTGNLVIGTAGKGIDFSADPSVPGMTSELLDDYEEGIWTPDLRFDGGNTGMTGTFTGYYTKVGRFVNVQVRVVLTSKGSSTGIATIEGLPFSSATYPAAIVDPSADFLGLVAGGATFVGLGGTSMYFLQQTVTGRISMTQANFGNSADLRLEATYIV